MGKDGRLQGEGLEDAIPDVFQLHVSKVDPVGDKVYPSIELVYLHCVRSPRWTIQALFEELF